MLLAEGVHQAIIIILPGLAIQVRRTHTQLTLYPNGDFRIASRSLTGEGLFGVCPGAGSPNPGFADLSAAVPR